MKFRILIFITFLFVIKSFAQKVISGKIIDNDTRNGVPFASIIYLNDTTMQGGYTDSLGIYTIKQLNLDLQISCIGYQTLKIKSSDLLQNNSIQLKPMVYELNAIEINPRKNIILQLGYFKNKAHTKLVMSSTQALLFRKQSNYIAQYISTPIIGKNSLITKLKYNLSNHFKRLDPVNVKGCEPTLLRVHLFEVDKSGKPGKEMLTKNMIFKNDCQTDNLIIDISEENIFLPDNGVFVGLEFIDNDRTSVSSNYPFYVVNNVMLNNNDNVINTYFSNHQEKWAKYYQHFTTLKGQKITSSLNVQFGIEVLQ